MAGRSVLGKRLKEARERAGLSQKALGIAAGIDEFSASPRINQYERSKHAPDFAIAERLAKVLGVPTPYLYSRDDDLAEVIRLFNLLTGKEQAALLADLRRKTKTGTASAPAPKKRRQTAE